MFTSIFFLNCVQEKLVGLYVSTTARQGQRFDSPTGKKPWTQQASRWISNEGEWENPVVKCLALPWHRALTRFKRNVGGKGWQVCFQSWSVFFKSSAFISTRLSREPKLWLGITQRNGLHLTVRREEERSSVFHREGWKSRVEFPSSDSSIQASVFPSERQLFIEPDCAATCSWKPLSCPNLWLRVRVCRFVFVCAYRSVNVSISMAMMSYWAKHLPW